MRPMHRIYFTAPRMIYDLLRDESEMTKRGTLHLRANNCIVKHYVAMSVIAEIQGRFCLN